MENYRILIVDDDENLRIGMATILEDEGFEVHEAENGRAGIEKLEQGMYDLIITDYKMNEMDGMRFLEQLKVEYPSLKVIMVTGFGTIEHAVEAMKLGAVNYMTKPVKPKMLVEMVKNVLQVGGEDEMSEEQKRNRLKKYYHFHDIVGQSKAMQQVYRKIKEVAGTDIPVLIMGESGTGKEMVAQAIHALSPRHDNTFIAVNTGAIPKELIASELFGHLKGAFTGAIADKKGKFEEANNGTLFLDEIGTMNIAVQISLLRVLETQVIERVGSNRSIGVDVRIIAATNDNLEKMIEDSQFREDLYYRLNVFTIDLPPLRERQGDISYLANFYRESFNLELGKKVEGITDRAMEALNAYHWPGNVRELRNIILRGVLTATNQIDLKHLPKNILKPGLAQVNITFKPGIPLSEVEKTMIMETLKAVRGNKLKAANILGISRRSLYNKLEEYDIEDSEL
ncbi:MAG: sigma-54-dependent Fis family transcriptional regulator [Calditrichaeota bacterium]|nr:sigma-54-dependent Fis family transcriptional regulator [Calditrichota bacterium]MCB0302681.1 sigma-54-dependent Fis family transcriptional regulator [Calditrichota bacterium]